MPGLLLAMGKTPPNAAYCGGFGQRGAWAENERGGDIGERTRKMDLGFLVKYVIRIFKNGPPNKGCVRARIVSRVDSRSAREQRVENNRKNMGREA